MSSQTLTTAHDFFEQVLKINYDRFNNDPSSFVTALNAALSLFHFHEWLFVSKKTDLEAKYTQTFKTKGDFWGFVEQQVPAAGYVRDVANASKHVVLKINPSTSMSHIANTAIVTTGSRQGGSGGGGYLAPSIMMKDGSNDVSFDACAQALYQFWDQLVVDLYP